MALFIREHGQRISRMLRFVQSLWFSPYWSPSCLAKLADLSLMPPADDFLPLGASTTCIRPSVTVFDLGFNYFAPSCYLKFVMDMARRAAILSECDVFVLLRGMGWRRHSQSIRQSALVAPIGAECQSVRGVWHIGHSRC
jgi:hypothetical protein